MTKAEAITHLENIILYSFEEGYTDKAREALSLAIEALKAEPSKDDMLKIEGMCEDAYEQGYQQARLDYETQPCGDAISRQETILIVQDIDMKSDVYEALRLIKELPSVTPERPNGEWIVLQRNSDGTSRCECRNCKNTMQLSIHTFDTFKFCPNCSADMRGEQE